MKNKAAVLLALVMVCLPAACGNAASNADSRSTGSNANNSNTNNSNVSTQTYTDVSVVKEIFPGLDGIESAEYEIVPLGSSPDNSVPGPLDYQYQGYIVLTDEAKENLVQAYAWEGAEPAVEFETIAERDGTYRYSPYLNRDVIKKSSYAGRVWLAEEENTVLFVVHTF
ncbi:MAG: hypothetical protein IJ600_02640 [Lachnospiraceae bacterium]|nr:hypothetical protein [Lachnospiraceae bacterium]